MDGVKILASGFEMDEKVEIGKLVIAMGGVLQTKASLDIGSHTYCSKRWFDQSVARRECLNEESYPVQAGSNTFSTIRTTNQHSLEKGMRNLQGLSSLATASNAQPVLCSRAADSDLEATLSQNMSATSSYAPVFIKEENSRAENPKSDYSAPVSTKDEDSGAPAEQENNACDGGVADDSQTDDNDLFWQIVES
ncbi:hypothetical protein K7X08_010142 [Anisodus acutangulus]|uniref:Uncharacterized protein n=1 Tax=Anisodus acutangulus TaxID=402998 RepID=A0A9Q1N523_9SOLA|nr:hypothetical protein K7X08_010142 [Anisodus acutangulus]